MKTNKRVAPAMQKYSPVLIPQDSIVVNLTTKALFINTPHDESINYYSVGKNLFPIGI